MVFHQTSIQCRMQRTESRSGGRKRKSRSNLSSQNPLLPSDPPRPRFACDETVLVSSSLLDSASVAQIASQSKQQIGLTLLFSLQNRRVFGVADGTRTH